MAQKLSSRSPKTPTVEQWTACNSAGYEAPAALAVDVVMLTVRDHQLLVLAVEASHGKRALPGGFVGPTEAPAETAVRKLREKTGLGEGIYLEQLATFAEPARDPRGWIPTVAYLALVPHETTPADDAAAWISASEPPPLAYDHLQILDTAVDRVRGKLWWSNVAVGILPDAFTLAQARATYEAIANTSYDPSTFARDLTTTGLIEDAGHSRVPTGGRPAALYRYREHLPTWGSGRRKRVQHDLKAD